MAPSNTPRVFPSLPDGLETRFAAIEIALAANPSYLNDPNCPYSERLRGFLHRLAAPATAERAPHDRVFENAPDGDKFDLALHEIEATIDEMSDIGQLLEKAEAPDRIQFVKAKTSLVEKWVTIKEKIFNLREISEFQAIVIRILDDVLSVDQRQAFIEALRALRTTAKAADDLAKESK